MQFERNRMYRVRAVAEALDVHPATIYRAIEAGRLDAYKIGAGGKGALRIPGHAIPVYLEDCAQAAYDAHVILGESAAEADQAAEGERAGEVV